MQDYLEQIQASLDAAIYPPALLCAITLPDVCGAVEHSLSKNGERYERWYDRYVGHQRLDITETLTGKTIWAIRNAMIHEARMDFRRFGFSRVMFSVRDRSNDIMHLCIAQGGDEKILQLDLQIFVQDMIEATRRWLNEIEHDADKMGRLSSLVQYRPNGLNILFYGVPAVC